MKTVNMQNQKILLQLYGILHCSFARYLSYARPWSRRPYTLLMAVSRKLAEEHKHFAAEIAHVLAMRRQITSSPTFPTDFTYYNDVSIEHLASKLLQHQRFLIGVTAAASGVLVADREINRILTKLLASLRKYADVLDDLLTRDKKLSSPRIPGQSPEYTDSGQIEKQVSAEANLQQAA